MDRTEFLEMCQKVAVLPRGVLGIKVVPPELCVTYKGMSFYPEGYKMTYEGSGKPLHTAILHDMKTISLIECELSKVERMCQK